MIFITVFSARVKIAIVGCGAVGSYYGAKLAQSGQEVHFLLRSDYETVRRQGVMVHSPLGDFRVHPKSARVPQEIGPCDLVVIALKTTANSAFPTLLPPLVSSATIVLTLQNGLGNEEQLAHLFPSRQILGGLCFVCLNRIAPGEVLHLDHGQIVIGDFEGPAQPRTHDLAAMFKAAGIPCLVSENLARVHWEKLVWNIPFNGLGVASAAGYEAVAAGQVPQLTAPEPCLTTDRLLADPKWLDLVRELMREVVVAGRALGHDIDPALVEKQIHRTKSMGPYKASTLLDFERGHSLELASLFLEPLRLAQAAGVAVPTMEKLCRVLRALDPGGG